MYSVRWTRNDSIRLGEIACQVGLTPDDAKGALTLGARFWAHDFTGYEIENMIHWQYAQWAEDERVVQEKTASPSQFRRWLGREKHHD